MSGNGHGVIKHKINGDVVMEYEQPTLDPKDPDGKRLLCGPGGPDTTINLWDLESGEVRPFEGHKAGC